MDALNAAYITEKSKIASAGAWLWLIEISTPGLSTLRYTNNNSNVEWPDIAGNVYSRMPLFIEDVKISTDGSFPEYKLQIGDVALNSTLRSRIKSYSGLSGSVIRLLLVHSDHLDITTAAIDESAEILGCEVTENNIIFTIGIPSFLSRRFPRNRYVPTFCRHKFKGAMCKYVQPSNSLTSTQISFISGSAGIENQRYNTIQVVGGGLITSIFGAASLDEDTGFTVSGSTSNDGFFLANKFHAVDDTYVRVYQEVDGAQPFTNESAGQSITIQLGYSGCDHTPEACSLRNNNSNYGGSPGVAGGKYG